MIGRKEDPRIVCFSGVVDRLDNATDHFVHVRDDRVILLPVHFDRMMCSRERSKFLVTEFLSRSNFFSKRILRQKVFGNQNLFQRILRNILRG